MIKVYVRVQVVWLFSVQPVSVQHQRADSFDRLHIFGVSVGYYVPNKKVWVDVNKIHS